MGLGDKFKDMAGKAQDAVAEHKEQIQDAVGAASVAADRKTGGKYTDKIHKFGQKANEAVDRAGRRQGDDPGGTGTGE
jgi:hypothetical protein